VRPKVPVFAAADGHSRYLDEPAGGHCHVRSALDGAGASEAAGEPGWLARPTGAGSVRPAHGHPDIWMNSRARPGAFLSRRPDAGDHRRARAVRPKVPVFAAADGHSRYLEEPAERPPLASLAIRAWQRLRCRA
jgi:hypothetical protein